MVQRRDQRPQKIKKKRPGTVIGYLCERTDMYRNIRDTEWTDVMSCLK